MKDGLQKPEKQQKTDNSLKPSERNAALQPADTLILATAEQSQNSHLQNYMIIKLYLLSCKLLVICLLQQQQQNNNNSKSIPEFTVILLKPQKLS